MAAVINTNYLSMVAQSNLTRSQSNLNTAIERLSSGLRINSAKDDVAGLAISNRMSAQIRAESQGLRNSQDAISAVQSTEGALGEMDNVLTRMRELATQASDANLREDDRSSAQKEFDDLTDELSSIVKQSSFGGRNLLGDEKANGLFSKEVKLQVGATSDDTMSIDVSAELGAMHAAIGAATGNYTGAGNSAGSNAGSELSKDNAKATRDLVNTAIDSVNALRGELGGANNRLEYTINTTSHATLQYSASASRIRDVDLAAETAATTRNNILSQAGINVLSQAHQLPTMALALLRQ